MKRVAKKASKRGAKRSTQKRTSKDANLGEVQQKVRNVISAHAVEIAEAVVEDVAKKAQVQPMKMLFEMVGLFGAEAGPEAPPEDDQALAKVLLDRFNLLDLPEAEEERAPLVLAVAPEADSVK
jgi:hypothetical protein